MKNIVIIGAGSFGVAIATMLDKKGYNIKMWTNSPEEAEMLNNEKEHKTKLPGIKLSDRIVCYTDTAKACENGEMFIVAVPSKFVRNVSKTISPFVKQDAVVVCVAKGIEEGSLKRLSEVIVEEIPQCKVGVLTGPSHAEEVSREVPTTVVASALDPKTADLIQEVFMTPCFRVYTNPDIIGAEIGGAIKNVIALCAGIADGLKLGDNTKAALISRGVSEITRLGEKMGGETRTFSGLTCMGDLIVTCMSMHSRNRRAGILIGEGYSVKDAMDKVQMVVEGVPNTKSAYELSKKYNVEMPIVEQAYKVVFEGQPAKEAIINLMQRGKKEEMGNY